MTQLRTAAAWVLLSVSLGMIALWVVASSLPLRAPPSALHRILPLPLACAGFSCVTYRSFARQLEAAGNHIDPTVLLTDILTSRAARVVARRSGLAVSNKEVDSATSVLGSLSSAEASLQKFLALQYGDLRSSEFREGMRDILLRRKLAAGGSVTVWDHPLAPAVALMQFRYQWDARTHRVVAR